MGRIELREDWRLQCAPVAPESRRGRLARDRHAADLSHVETSRANAGQLWAQAE